MTVYPTPGERFCPGAVYTPAKGVDRCLCGASRAHHTHEHDGRGGFRRINDDAVCEVANCLLCASVFPYGSPVPQMRPRASEDYPENAR